jgi:predicted RNA-binding Zn-ribbon protein involved in translation (DUF1610 family)
VKPIVVMFPGASLMEITAHDDALSVRCPGCGNEQTYRAFDEETFIHEERCPTYARIKQAIARYGKAGINRG